MTITVKGIVGAVILVWVVMIFSACGTTRTKISVTGADGAKQEMLQSDITPPFGKKDEAIGKMHSKRGADGSFELETGQSAKGIDNTAQGAVLQGMFAIMLQMYTQYVAAHPPQAPKPSTLEEILPYLGTPVVPGTPTPKVAPIK